MPSPRGACARLVSTLVLAVAALAGCDDQPAARAVDAGGDAASALACDPLAAAADSGCAAGQRCTWIVTGAAPASGVVGCAPIGAVPLHGACTVGPPGLTTGFDDCGLGAACFGGACESVCGLAGATSPACTTSEACVRVSGLFAADDEDGVAGVCQPTCDPLASDGCGDGRGCYPVVGEATTSAVCAAAGSRGPGEVLTAPIFANTCRPGFAPRPRGDGAAECGALCRPRDVARGLHEADEGGVAPDTCAARGAPAPDDPQAGESCRYWWAREPFDGLSRYSNTLGWCFRHAGGVDTRCVDLAPDDAALMWCLTRPSPLLGGRGAPGRGPTGAGTLAARP